MTRARGARDHWRNAQENVFCTAALAEYADDARAAGVEMFDSTAIGS